MQPLQSASIGNKKCRPIIWPHPTAGLWISHARHPGASQWSRCPAAFPARTKFTQVKLFHPTRYKNNCFWFQLSTNVIMTSPSQKSFHYIALGNLITRAAYSLPLWRHRPSNNENRWCQKHSSRSRKQSKQMQHHSTSQFNKQRSAKNWYDATDKNIIHRAVRCHFQRNMFTDDKHLIQTFGSTINQYFQWTCTCDAQNTHVCTDFV